MGDGPGRPDPDLPRTSTATRAAGWSSPPADRVITYRATMVVPDAVDDADEDAPELPADELPDETY